MKTGKIYKLKNNIGMYNTPLLFTDGIASDQDQQILTIEDQFISLDGKGKLTEAENVYYIDFKILYSGKVKYLTISELKSKKFRHSDYFIEIKTT